MKRHQIIFSVLMIAVLLASAHSTLAQGTMFVDAGNVGIGVETPASLLHLQKSDGSARLLIEEQSSTVTVRELLRLVNSGGPFFVFADSSKQESYSFAMSGSGDFIISQQQLAGVEFRLRPNGDLTIAGTLVEGSSREIKEQIIPVEGREVLARVVDLPLAEWTYKTDPAEARHLGPMAEDFRASFGLGPTDKGISTRDMTGVALAAIQGLHQLIEEQSREIERLQNEVMALKVENASND